MKFLSAVALFDKHTDAYVKSAIKGMTTDKVPLASLLPSFPKGRAFLDYVTAKMEERDVKSRPVQ
eukprot:6301949-Prorocentrum_lima.AAC.1